MNWNSPSFPVIPSHIGRLHFNVLCFTALCKYCFFDKSKVLWQPCLEQSYWLHFPNSSACFVALCQNVALHAMSQTFPLFPISQTFPLYGDLRSVGAFQVALVVKNSLAKAGDIEMQVQSLGQEDPLEEVVATHSSILAWRIPWTEEPWGLQSMGSQRVGHDWRDLEQHSAWWILIVTSKTVRKKPRNIAMGHVLLRCWNDCWIRYIFVSKGRFIFHVTHSIWIVCFYI